MLYICTIFQVTVHYATESKGIDVSGELAVIIKLLSINNVKQATKKLIEGYKDILFEEVLQVLNTELSGYCSEKRPSILRQKSGKSITKISTTDIYSELKERCPMFTKTIQSVSSLKCDNQDQISTCASLMSFILHSKNQRMSAYAYKLGYYLRWAGLSTSVSFHAYVVQSVIVFDTSNLFLMKLVFWSS